MTLLTGSYLLLIFCGMAPPDRPPKLEFDHHVDYAAWFNDLVSRGKTENSLELYNALVPSATPHHTADEKEGTSSNKTLPLMSEQEMSEATAFNHRPWDKSEYPALADYIQKNELGLQAFNSATSVKDYWHPVENNDDSLAALSMHNPKTNRAAVRAIVAQAWLRPKYEASTLLDAELVVLRHVSHMRQCSTTIGGLVAEASRSLIYTSLRSACDLRLWSESQAARAYKTARKVDRDAIDWPVLVRVEWATALSSLQLVCRNGKPTIEGWKRYWLLLGEEGDIPRSSLTLLMQTNPKKTAEQLDEFFMEYARIVEGPLRWQRADELSKAIPEFLPDDTEHSTARLFKVDLTRAYELSVRTESERRGTMLTLAICAHHRRHGAWPKTLSDIDPNLGLKGLKTYRIDPFTGKPFVYRLRKEGPILYSVGADGKDDRGKHDSKFGEHGTGGDFVFWQFQRSK